MIFETLKPVGFGFRFGFGFFQVLPFELEYFRQKKNWLEITNLDINTFVNCLLIDYYTFGQKYLSYISFKFFINYLK